MAMGEPRGRGVGGTSSSHEEAAGRPRVLYRTLSTPTEIALGRMPTNHERSDVRKELALAEAQDNEEAETIACMQTGTSLSHLRSNLRHKAALNAAARQLSMARAAAAGMEADESGAGESAYERELREAEERVPHWREALTLRAAFAACLVGSIFCIVSLKLGLTSGVPAHLDVGCGLLSYFSIIAGRKLAGKWGRTFKPFTAQEATVIQAAAAACYGLVFSGGLYTFVIAMSSQSYANIGTSTPGNTPESVENPKFLKMVAYLFCISIFGVFMMVPLRRKLVIDMDLAFPSGTATGAMITSFFSETGGALARLQIRSLFKWTAASFAWSGWMWLWTGKGSCGTVSGGYYKWPTFGLPALAYTWNFNWGPMTVGLGMLSPAKVGLSMLFGALISWGLMWPLIDDHEGDWYPAGLPKKSMEGMEGYRVWTSSGLVFADGLYVICKLCVLFWLSRADRKQARKGGKLVAQRTLERRRERTRRISLGRASSADEGGLETLDEDKSFNAGSRLPSALAKSNSDDSDDGVTLEEMKDLEEEELSGVDMLELRRRVFDKGDIPNWLVAACYVCFLGLAVGCVPLLYPPAKWYFVLALGLLAPFPGLANAYGVGLTDWSTASLWGKLFLFLVAALAGESGNGVIAGLAACGVAFASVANAAMMTQTFMTGYLTLSSPRTLLAAQVFGTAIGSVIAPACFQLYWSAFPVGDVDGQFPAPLADVYRAMAVVAVSGVSALPRYCLLMTGCFFGLGLAINVARDLLPPKYGRWLPIPLAMALPFYLGAWLGVSTAIGALVVIYWRWVDHEDCEAFHHSVSCGLISGDGIWAIPAGILALAGVEAPMCMGWSRALRRRG